MESEIVRLVDEQGYPLVRAEERTDFTSGLADPADWVYDTFGAAAATSGVRVNRKTALTFAAYWRGRQLISETIGKTTLMTLKREGRAKNEAKDHPAYNLLRYEPNSEMSAFTWKSTIEGHAVDFGNGYSYIQKKKSGEPLELWPLNPECTYPIRRNGVLWYVTTIEGEMSKIPADDILHRKGMGFDGLVGYPALQYARNTLGLAMATTQHSATYFRNGAVPLVVLEHPGKMPAEDREKLRESWERLYTGIDKAHRTAVLWQGMKASVIGKNAKDSQLVELMGMNIRDVSTLLGLTPNKLGDTTRTSYKSLESEEQANLNDCYDPRMVDWEQECRRKLLTENEKRADSHLFLFRREELIRADITAQSMFYNMALSTGLACRDEIRSKLGWNPIPDGEGEKFYIQVNMAELGSDAVSGEADPATGNKPAATDDDEDDRASRALLTDVATRMSRRILTQAKRASKSAEGFVKWLEDMEASNGAAVGDSFRSVMACIDPKADPVSEAQSFFQTIRSSLAMASADAAPGKLAALLASRSGAIQANAATVAVTRVFSRNREVSNGA